MLALAGTERGERRCERALLCSRVCPTGVYPARHIMELRRDGVHPAPDESKSKGRTCQNAGLVSVLGFKWPVGPHT